jgi:hypothetical protein
MVTIGLLSQAFGTVGAQAQHGMLVVQYDRHAAEPVYYQHVQEVPGATREELINRAFASLHTALQPEGIEMLQYNPAMGRFEARVALSVPLPNTGTVAGSYLRVHHHIAVTAINGTYKLELTQFQISTDGYATELDALLTADDNSLEALLSAQTIAYDYRRAMLLQNISGSLQELVTVLQHQLEQPGEGVAQQ